MDGQGIKINTLGQFRIVMPNGNEYFPSGRSTRLWSLFKLLLVNNNKGITADAIVENAYPQIDYVDPHNAVQNMIYRLRKLLATESIFENSKDIITYNDGCYKLDFTKDIWIDFMELEKSVETADAIIKDNPLKAIDHYRNAFSIYGGDFLPELYYEDWVVPKRIFYRSLYLKTILNLSKLYADQKAYDNIIQLCQKGLTIEPFEEEIHIQLIENLIRVGKVRQAKNHYENTITAFAKEFGIQPTQEMLKMADLLKIELVPIQIDRRDPSKTMVYEENSGAFLCDYRDFYTIYNLEKRKCERSGDAVCPICIDFDDEINVFESDVRKDSTIEGFKEILVKDLRKGDVVSLHNNTQFYILLHKAEYQIVKLVMKRIMEKFTALNAFKDMVLEVNVCTRLPKPNGK